MKWQSNDKPSEGEATIRGAGQRRSIGLRGRGPHGEGTAHQIYAKEWLRKERQCKGEVRKGGARAKHRVDLIGNGKARQGEGPAKARCWNARAKKCKAGQGKGKAQASEVLQRHRVDLIGKGGEVGGTGGKGTAKK